MRSWRFTVLWRVVALSLLLWTAVDLADVTACALDNERLGTLGSSQDSIIAHRDAPGNPAPPVHVDDCFCCSHCVDVEAFIAASSVTIPKSRPETLANHHLLLLATPFYHPPQALVR